MSSIGPSLPPNRPPDDAGVDELVKAAGWDTVPLFMKDLPEELNRSSSNSDTPVNPSIEALQALIYDDDDDGKVRSIEALKSRANELFGCRQYRQALGFYTQAVEILVTLVASDANQKQSTTSITPTIPKELKDSVYSNRAACHLALGNFRSCLSDCATVLSPPLPTPASKVIRKCFFRSSKSLLALGRFDEALDCIKKLISSDQRDGVAEDDEPKKLKEEIELQINQLANQKRDRELANERRQVVTKVLRREIQSRGILLPTQFPPPESSLSPGFEAAHFEKVPENIEPSAVSTSAESWSIVYPVYIFRPKDDCPTRDLVLHWHEDDLMSDRLEQLCDGTNTHHFYVITSKRRILKCGNNLTLRKILHSIRKTRPDDFLRMGDQGELEMFLLPKGKLENEWIEETKKGFCGT